MFIAEVLGVGVNGLRAVISLAAIASVCSGGV